MQKNIIYILEIGRNKLNNAKCVNSYQISEECNINHIIHHFDKKQPCGRTTICHLCLSRLFTFLILVPVDNVKCAHSFCLFVLNINNTLWKR